MFLSWIYLMATLQQSSALLDPNSTGENKAADLIATSTKKIMCIS
jgi:hypothetical protein